MDTQQAGPVGTIGCEDGVGVDAGAVSRDAAPRGRATAARTYASALLTAVALLLVWAALLLPDDLGLMQPVAFLRVPVEALVLLVLAVVLPRRPAGALAVASGLVLGVLTLVRLLDMGFGQAFGRPFDPLYDWGYFGAAVGFLESSMGRVPALAATAAALVGAAALLVALPWAALRVARRARAHRRGSLVLAAVLAAVALLGTLLGLQVRPGTPVVSTGLVALSADHVGRVRQALQDEQDFERAAAVDTFRDDGADALLGGLRGKDVLVVFVESYGRVALEDPDIAAPVRALLDRGTQRLRAAGFIARSGFLKTPTLGGGSWLAHATLQSGLWISNDKRYDELLDSDRLTLPRAFARAGWRTVADDPANERPWPEGQSFYGYEQVYDQSNVGYRGPSFGFASIPDQYTLDAFRKRELGPGHAPVMAEMDLVTSHSPWAPLPTLVDWDRVGDGSVFGPMPARADSPKTVWHSPERIRAAYGASIRYSLGALISWVERYGGDNLVLVVLGDHQPAPIVSGEHAVRQVPISIVAHDPAVLSRIDGWHWQEGLRPAADSPVLRMDDFRARFLSAYAR